jgi:class 3 adenylate cyclase
MLKDVGLGIGIGFGAVHLLNMGGVLTVVGKAVVHACRLAAAPAGTIYLNQPAFEKVTDKLRHVLFLSEEEVLMKHEKASVCYRASLTRHDYQPERPFWTKDENGEAR